MRPRPFSTTFPRHDNILLAKVADNSIGINFSLVSGIFSPFFIFGFIFYRYFRLNTRHIFGLLGLILVIFLDNLGGNPPCFLVAVLGVSARFFLRQR